MAKAEIISILLFITCFIASIIICCKYEKHLKKIGIEEEKGDKSEE